MLLTSRTDQKGWHITAELRLQKDRHLSCLPSLTLLSWFWGKLAVVSFPVRDPCGKELVGPQATAHEKRNPASDLASELSWVFSFTGPSDVTKISDQYLIVPL